MRALIWAFDAWKTPLGKIIAVILSVSLIFSCSNAFLFSSQAFAAGDEGQTEEPTGTAEEEASGSGPTSGSDSFAPSDEDAEKIESDDEDDAEETIVVEEIQLVRKTSDAISTFSLLSERTRGDEAVPAADGSDSATRPADMTRVYVYVEITGDIDGWTKNEKGWYTIGYIEVPASELPAAEDGSEADESVVFPYLGNIVRHEDNADMSFDLDAVTWSKGNGNAGLHAADGANGFGVGEAAWHLDGLLNITSDYTVTYSVEGCDETAPDPVSNTAVNNKGTEGVTGSSVKAVPGYRFLGWFKGDQKITDELILSADLAAAKVNSGTNNGRTKYLDTTFVARYAKEVTVSYAWDFALEGAPALPEGATLASGEPYEVSAIVYDPISIEDAYGNVTGTWTFGGWDQSGTITVDEDLVITGAWIYEGMDVPTWGITYVWSGDAPAGHRVPVDDAEYVNNQPYQIDTTYTAQTVIDVKDDFGNVVERYAFSGWDTPDGTITSNLTVTGTWTKETFEIPTHKVMYSWSNLPEATLYDEKGNVVTPTLPGDISDLVKGQPYTIDGAMPGTVVYTHDEHGNKDSKYTLGRWVDGSNGVMGDADVTVTGTWYETKEHIPSYVVEYGYEGAVPVQAPVPPEGASHRVNEPVEVAPIPALDGWVFEGWTVPEGITVDEHGTFVLTEVPEGTPTYTFTGTWKPVDADAISVDAIDVIYDGEEHPLTVSGALKSDVVTFEVEGAAFANEGDAVKNVTDVTVIVKVERDGIVVKELETTVKISPAPLSIQIVGNSDEVHYNGESQSVEGYEATFMAGDEELEALPEDLAIECVKEAIATGTHAVTHKMGLQGTSFWISGNAYGNYAIEFSVTDGALTILPVSVIVVVEDASKVVGTADPVFAGTVLGSIYNDELAFDYVRPNAGTDEAVGAYEDAIEAHWTENPDYSVSMIPGTFTITAAPAPAPVGPTTPTPTPAPTVPPTVTPAPAVAPGVTAAVPVTAIADDAAPLAAPQALAADGAAEPAAEATIEDDETPLSAFDEPHCWVHILMIIGIIMSLLYGLCVVLRRLAYAHEIKRLEEELAGQSSVTRRAGAESVQPAMA